MAKYMITGVDKQLRRFNPIRTDTPQHYNIYRGTVWELLKNDPKGRKRKILYTIWN